MDIYKTFAVDEELLASGVWRVIEPATDFPVEESEIGDRSAVLVASMDNPQYRRTVERLAKPHQMRRGVDLDSAIRDRITMQAIAEVIILDWRNWEIAGEKISYSQAKALEILTEPKWVRLKERLMGMIGDVDVFKAEQEHDIVKNS